MPHFSWINMTLSKDLYLFCRKLTYKFLFDHERILSKQDRDISESIKHSTMDERRAFRDLILLLEESDSSEPGVPITDSSEPTPSLGPKSIKKFKSKSKKFPDLTTNPQVWAFLTATIGDIRQIILDPMPKKLSSDQLQSISRLRKHPDLVGGKYCTND